MTRPDGRPRRPGQQVASFSQSIRYATDRRGPAIAVVGGGRPGGRTWSAGSGWSAYQRHFFS
ncbi:hypothetical protein O7606_19695 [Micromonospora sp. WMMD882]|uniref:hypothetical protein n=1 Tax=Micromonospora sp. WMMD882 TaxID=3015151 RepID=UPI00248C36F5|nr:hypothetical protein [Micromonospora sp. WMMD882]WBB78433.1 hypothetical protein O7606_19695 [Micromonospora sp. WMMD882]